MRDDSLLKEKQTISALLWLNRQTDRQTDRQTYLFDQMYK